MTMTPTMTEARSMRAEARERSAPNRSRRRSRYFWYGVAAVLVFAICCLLVMRYSRARLAHPPYARAVRPAVVSELRGRGG